jgi:hypothetical protein
MSIEQTDTIGFKELEEMASCLNGFLTKGFGISFHNQGGFYLQDDNGLTVYEMRYLGEAEAEIGRTFPLVIPFFRPSKLSLCSPHPSEIDKDVIALGPEGTIWGITRGSYEDNNIDSRKYGPKILEIKVHTPHWSEPRFDFKVKQRIFWDKS